MKVQRLVGALKLMGPAFLVSVAYLDPGNWATAIEAGSRFGYKLIWVVVLSNLIALLLQTLAARLGLVTGKHLAEVCREQYPTHVCFLLWIICEVSIVALDLTMVLGTAIGLNMLFHLPVLPCIMLTGLDALMVFFAVPYTGIRWSELLTAGLVGLVLLCFLVDVFLSAPPLASVIQGMWPRLERESIYTAVSLLGANVMPHNFYLHSALVKGRGHDGQSMDALCHYNFIDVTCALGIALLINLAVLLVSASTFFSSGMVVETLQDAHDVMEQVLSSSIAPAVFGLALLIAGQLSTFTGTIAGQVVLKGFLNCEVRPWIRRLITRSAAIVPAAILHRFYGDKGTYRVLVIAQVLLALQLPFTLIPLIKATSERKLMGRYANGPLLQVLAWASTALIFLASLMLFVSLCVPSAGPNVEKFNASGADLALHINQWLTETSNAASKSPLKMTVIVLMTLCSSLALALLCWMAITPFAHGLTDKALIPLFSKHLDWESHDVNLRREQIRLRHRDQALEYTKQQTIQENQDVSKQERLPSQSMADEGVEVAPKGWHTMTRGGRRQFSTILDKFWGQFYDLHGGQICSYPEGGMQDTILECKKAIDGIEGIPPDHVSPPWKDVDLAFSQFLNSDSDATNSTPPMNPMYLFGLWCLIRLLEVCEGESRPELWGRYALVLNRLQWILPTLRTFPVTGNALVTDVVRMLGLVEVWIKERKGPKGTGAGEVAFPKGKEIIMSVTKRYRRHLGVTNEKQRRRVEYSVLGVTLTGAFCWLSMLAYTRYAPYYHPVFLREA